jgi:hypothetical protein
MPARQVECADRPGQRHQDLVAAGGAVIGFTDGVEPPLQTDLAKDRFGHHFPGLGDFQVEGIESEQRLSPFRRSEQSGEKPVFVVFSDFLPAVGQCRVGVSHEI